MSGWATPEVPVRQCRAWQDTVGLYEVRMFILSAASEVHNQQRQAHQAVGKGTSVGSGGGRTQTAARGDATAQAPRRTSLRHDQTLDGIDALLNETVT